MDIFVEFMRSFLDWQRKLTGLFIATPSWYDNPRVCVQSAIGLLYVNNIKVDY